MKIEVFYVPDCPHHVSAVKQLRAVLLAEGVRSEINEVVVMDARTAEEYGFRGSPTVRINGQDIAAESNAPPSFAFACRLYPGAKVSGVPPLDMMQRAVREARSGEKK
jgi:hypothetical protein